MNEVILARCLESQGREVLAIGQPHTAGQGRASHLYLKLSVAPGTAQCGHLLAVSNGR